MHVLHNQEYLVFLSIYVLNILPVTKCEESTFASWTETVSLSPIYVHKIPFKFFTSIYIE